MPLQSFNNSPSNRHLQLSNRPAQAIFCIKFLRSITFFVRKRQHNKPRRRMCKLPCSVFCYEEIVLYSYAGFPLKIDAWFDSYDVTFLENVKRSSFYVRLDVYVLPEAMAKAMDEVLPIFSKGFR